MIARAVALLVALVVLLVVQTSVLPLVAVAGYRPDLVLLLVVAVAAVDGPEPGARTGFSGGLLTDLLLHGSAVGVAALAFALAGYAVGVARPYLAPQSLTAPLLLVLGGSLLGQLLLGLLGRALGGAPTALTMVMGGALFVAVAHTLLAPLALRAARALSARLPAEASGSPR